MHSPMTINPHWTQMLNKYLVLWFS